MLDNITRHPIFVYHQEIAEICRPLRRLNITYFANVRITNDNYFCGISNNPPFIEHYLRKKYYSADIHLIDNSKIGDFILWEGIEFTKIGEQICKESSELGVNKPFTIIKKNNEWIDFYHFASDVDDKRINQVYLANINLLYNFIEYFSEQIAKSKKLSASYQYLFNMNTTIASPIMTNLGDSSLLFDKSDIFQDLKLQKKSRPQIENVSLSKRQDEILRFLVMGKTIKEISKILDLSPRTVGHYFETVKNKFNVYTKSELIAKTANSYIKFL